MLSSEKNTHNTVKQTKNRYFTHSAQGTQMNKTLREQQLHQDRLHTFHSREGGTGSKDCVSHSVGSKDFVSHSVGSKDCVSHSVGSKDCVSHSVGSKDCVSHSAGSKDSTDRLLT